MATRDYIAKPPPEQGLPISNTDLSSKDSNDIISKAEQAARRAKQIEEQKASSRWKRAALLFFFVGVLIIAFRIFIVEPNLASNKPQIVHADRYSEKYKYRPAASPVITEKLKDGRLLVRGAFRGEL